jgi:putative tryptophan/tyrosine transport system substrate-binding protein
VNPTNPTLSQLSTTDIQAAARSLGLEIQVLNASTDHDFDAAFAAAAQRSVDALLLDNDFLFFGQRQLAPVTLAPGRFMLVTSPPLTGSRPL